MAAKSTNGKSAKAGAKWGKIERIDAHLIPPDQTSEFWPLFTDFSLRLERTPSSEGLYATFPDGGERAAKQSLALLFSRRLGKGAVKVSAGLTREGIPAVFVQRGPNYPSPEPEGTRPRKRSTSDDEVEVDDFE